MTRLGGMFAVVVILGWSAGAMAWVNMDMAPVGNPGNAPEWSGESQPGGYGPDSRVGGVDYAYSIGKYEVTAGQYCEFLNAVATTDYNGLYNANMWSNDRGCKIEQIGSSGNYTYTVSPDRANRPVNYVGWHDSLRFANWMHNGQPTGPQDGSTTEDGAYDMLEGDYAVRKAGAQVFLPSEDEWYKAAYYDPNKPGGAGYWDYPTAGDDLPGRDITESTNSGNNANYYGNPPYPIDSPYFTTIVGEFELSSSPYGTFDQGGNVWEWNEAVIGTHRGMRGGAFDNDDTRLLAAGRYYGVLTEYSYAGFRIAEVPEPNTLVLLALGGMVIVRRRRVSVGVGFRGDAA